MKVSERCSFREKIMSIKELDSQYIAHTYGRYPIVLKEGNGALLFDEDGKRYIDMGSGIGVSAFGSCDKEWVEAVTAQLNTLQHTSNLYYTEPCARLAEILCKRTGFKKVFFSNSGAESNECAIKAARKYGSDNYGNKRTKILTLQNSFHGRTITTLAATGQAVFHKDFLPLTSGFDYVEANNIDDLVEKTNGGDVIAIMFETIQGEGGVMPLTKEFVEKINEIAARDDVLMIVDEVQTGNGRTGSLFGYMNYGIKPDIVTTAKGLGGGLPIGATLLGEKVENVFVPGSHGSTFGGNPVCAAGAISVIERIDDVLLADVKRKSEYIFKSLEGAKGVKSVSGMGLMIGIETERKNTDILAEAREKGVLALSAKTKVRLLPPLNITDELLAEAIDILKEIIAK